MSKSTDVMENGISSEDVVNSDSFQKKEPAPSSMKDSGDDAGDEGVSPMLLLLAMLVILVGGYFLCMKLIQMSRTEDCLMSGRHNCSDISGNF